MSWAKVGMKVVCIADQFYALNPEDISVPDLPKGSIYTIRDVEDSVGKLWLSFCECPEDDQYDSSEFRPLITKTIEEDVQMFKRIADRVPNMEAVE